MSDIYYPLGQRITWWFRWLRLKADRGVMVSAHAYVAPSAKFQVNYPDGYGCRGNVHIAAGVRISDGVILAPYGGNIHLEENVFIGPYCVLYGHGGLHVGKNTLIAAHTIIIPANHSFLLRDPVGQQPLTRRGIHIGEDVWIGCDVKILDGVTIGRGAVIGAGAVVADSVEDFAVAVGVPAKMIRRRDESESKGLVE